MHENTKTVRKQAGLHFGCKCVRYGCRQSAMTRRQPPSTMRLRMKAGKPEIPVARRIHQHSFWYSPHRLNDKVSRLLPFPVTEPPWGFFVFLAVSRASANMGADAFPSA